MVGETSKTRRFEPSLSGLADGGTAPFVLVVGRHVADAGMEADPVPSRADDVELLAQHLDVGDRLQVRVLGFQVSVEALDPGLIGRGAGSAEVLGDRAEGHELARRARGHLRAVVRHGEQDRPAGIVGGDVHPPVGAALDGVEQPSAAKASVKTISTWVEVSSDETMWASHLRDTRSSTMVTAARARVKCVVA